MFPFHQRGLVSFQVTNDGENPTTNTSQTNINHQKIEQDANASSSAPISPPIQYYPEELNHNNYLVGNYQNTRKGTLRSSILSISEEVSNIKTKEDEFSTEDAAARKRTMHREIERQRRHELANLYSSLRSLLPIEYIKGKRSICDHITEAARYIKDLEKNVKELGEKRDKLKDSSSSSSLDMKLSEARNVGCSSSCTSSSSRSDCVSIHSFSSSIEIEIGSHVRDGDAFPLSRVLALLIEEGLSVVSCVSSKVNQRWIHIIHCEVNDGTLIDLNRLEWRLTSEIHSYES